MSEELDLEKLRERLAAAARAADKLAAFTRSYRGEDLVPYSINLRSALKGTASIEEQYIRASYATKRVLAGLSGRLSFLVPREDRFEVYAWGYTTSTGDTAVLLLFFFERSSPLDPRSEIEPVLVVARKDGKVDIYARAHYGVTSWKGLDRATIAFSPLSHTPAVMEAQPSAPDVLRYLWVEATKAVASITPAAYNKYVLAGTTLTDGSRVPVKVTPIVKRPDKKAWLAGFIRDTTGDRIPQPAS